jgi:hypothetical protein
MEESDEESGTTAELPIDAELNSPRVTQSSVGHPSLRGRTNAHSPFLGRRVMA